MHSVGLYPDFSLNKELFCHLVINDELVNLLLLGCFCFFLFVISGRVRI